VSMQRRTFLCLSVAGAAVVKTLTAVLYAGSNTVRVFKSNIEDRRYMSIEEYGGRGYLPFTTTDLNSGQWTAVSSYTMPGRPRHGTVPAHHPGGVRPTAPTVGLSWPAQSDSTTRSRVA
jgi:hypothetical protein